MECFQRIQVTQYIAKTVSFIFYCVGHQNPPFSSQTWQGATSASFCRILDREEALESSNALL